MKMVSLFQITKNRHYIEDHVSPRICTIQFDLLEHIPTNFRRFFISNELVYKLIILTNHLLYLLNKIKAFDKSFPNLVNV